jgi:hypothetical protein
VKEERKEKTDRVKAPDSKSGHFGGVGSIFSYQQKFNIVLFKIT